jgi:hypothetical protein
MKRFPSLRKYVPVASEAITLVSAIGAFALMVWKWIKEVRQ